MEANDDDLLAELLAAEIMRDSKFSTEANAQHGNGGDELPNKKESWASASHQLQPPAVVPRSSETKATSSSGSVGTDDEMLLETLLELKSTSTLTARDVERMPWDQQPPSPVAISATQIPVGSSHPMGAAAGVRLQAKTHMANLETSNVDITSSIPGVWEKDEEKKKADGKKPSIIRSNNDHSEVENDAQILSAVMDAIDDCQSSVSGDLLSDVDDVIERAEHVAASSTRMGGKGGRGKSTRIVRVHEHMDMREELQRLKQSVGWPTCVCTCLCHADSTSGSVAKLCSSPLKRKAAVCVGTTFGFVLFFDTKRRFIDKYNPSRSIFSGSSKKKGAVSMISMAYDASVIMAGYETGVLVLFDSASLSPLRTITGEYDTPIVRLRHCQLDPLRVLVLGNCGGVKLISFSRLMIKLVYRTINVTQHFCGAPFSDVDLAFIKGEKIHLAAAVSNEALLVFAVDCGMQNVAHPLYQRALKTEGSSQHLQLQFVSIPSENKLYLCIAHNTSVQVFIVAEDGMVVELKRLTNIRLETPLRAITSIDSFCLLLDQENVCHLFDVSTNVVVESQQIHEFEPSYFSNTECSPRYSGTITCSGRTAFLVGHSSTFSCTLLSWRERLDDLVSKNRFYDALELMKDFSLDVALAASGLGDNKAERHMSIHSYLVTFGTTFIAHVLKTSRSPLASVDNIARLIKYCADLDAMHVFFGPMMEHLCSEEGGDTLTFYALERCVVAGMVTSVPEVYIERLFTVLDSGVLDADIEPPRSPAPGGKGATIDVTRAERALMKLENGHESLLPLAEKFNLVLLKVSTLCQWQHEYADALQYALGEWRRGNRGATARREIAVDLFEATMRGYNILGNVEIPEQWRCRAKEQIWSHLLTTPDDFGALLRVNAGRVVRVALPVLQESGQYSPWGNEAQRNLCASRLLLHLVGVDFESNNQPRPWELEQCEWPPYTVVQELFTGIIQLVLSGVITFSPMQSFFDFACSHLIYQFRRARDEAQRRSAQSDVISLITSPNMEMLNFAFVEASLRQQHMGRALAALHCSRMEYVEAIDCYLRKEYNRVDSALSKDVFHFIRAICRTRGAEWSEARSKSLCTAVMHHIARLVEVDPASLAQFVFEYFPDNHDVVMNTLRKSGKTFLRYIDGLVARAEPKNLRDVKLQNTYIGLLCSHDPNRVYQYLRAHEKVLMYDYNTVLCAAKQYKVTDATVYLLEKGRRIGEAMDVLVEAIADKLQELVQRTVSEVILPCDATASTETSHVRANVEGAQCGGSRLAYAKRHVPLSCTRNEKEAAISESWEETLCTVVGQVVDFCSKYYATEDAQSYRAWFALFGCFTLPDDLPCSFYGVRGAAESSGSVAQHSTGKIGSFTSNDPTPSPNLTPDAKKKVIECLTPLYTKYASHVILRMIGVLSLPNVIRRLAEVDTNDKFVPFHTIIRSILDALRFEHDVNTSCALFLNEHVIKLSTEHHERLHTGVMPLSIVCYMCGEVLATTCGVGAGISVRIYGCGHAYHETCAMGAADEYQYEDQCIQCCKEGSGDTPPSKGDGKKTDAETREGEDGSVKEDNGDEGDESVEKDCLRVMVRRLEHTRSKMDGPRECRERLRRFLCQDRSSAKVATEASCEAPTHKSAEILAMEAEPALQPPLRSPTDSDDGTAMKLTDDEVLELFGT
uniref:Uncharacterized protein TCIL3000_11_11740 n=1 Tax=Trypanosoma congolense (strain IL3000) TaxID=1068625 RepID=G0V210_TRYCI|nr:unnamed protein product [Trypanosoma congolense IL3000]